MPQGAGKRLEHLWGGFFSTVPRVLCGVAAMNQNHVDLGAQPGGPCWQKETLVCQLGSWQPRCPEMMGKGFYWLWPGSPLLGMLSVTGGSPGTPCLFSLHKDSALRSLQAVQPDGSSPVVTHPLKDDSLSTRGFLLSGSPAEISWS